MNKQANVALAAYLHFSELENSTRGAAQLEAKQIADRFYRQYIRSFGECPPEQPGHVAVFFPEV